MSDAHYYKISLGVLEDTFGKALMKSRGWLETLGIAPIKPVSSAWVGEKSLLFYLLFVRESCSINYE